MTAADRAADPELTLARVYLNRVCEPAHFGLWAYVEQAGPVEAARTIRAGTAPQPILRACAARRSSADPERDLLAAQALGISLLTPESADWPRLAFGCLDLAAENRLLAIARGGYRRDDETGDAAVPPLALWVRGPASLVDLGHESASVVGSRASTAYGEHVAAELGYGLARRDVVVVSGGAFGVDAAAHRSALAAGGVTVLVSAAGLDRPYPSGNAALFEAIGSSGALVSESPPGCSPHRQRFLSRNRIIAALGEVTVIVEAARRSGALNTAKHCRLLGRPVLAVPGPITSALSVGCHDLLARVADPAGLACSVDDVLALVGGADGRRSPPSSAGAGSTNRPATRIEMLDELSPTARRVFDGFPTRGAVQMDALARLSGVPEPDVMRALPALSAVGLVELVEGGWRICR